MRRKAYAKLLHWKNSHRRKPLIVRGARQVGKTYLLKEFAKNEYEQYCYLNFEEVPQLKSLFSQELEPKKILQNISIYLNQKITAENTLIIFDEIQECPSALTSLKYFNEQANEYHIISAGSLLGVKLAKEKGFPVGKVNFLNLYPLNFFEFLDAIDKTQLKEYLTAIENFEPIPEPIHSKLLECLRYYFFIGGMPESVKEYVNTGNFSNVRAVQNDILHAYLLDFAKHATKSEIMKITEIWQAIPGQLAKENKKFVFSAIRKSARARDYETAIQWLCDAGLIYKSYRISKPNLPLTNYADKNIYKIFLFDVGLLGAMSKLSPQVLLQGDDLFIEFKGSLSENFVAEELKENLEDELYYWASEGAAEIDFVITYSNEIFPLEVKSGFITKAKSLKVYQEKYQPRIISRSTLMNLKKDGDICNYPLYLISRFPIIQ